MTTSPASARVTADAAGRLLARLRVVPVAELPERVWDLVPPEDRDLFFDLLAVAADLPRLGTARVLDRPEADAAWPALAEPLRDARALQAVADRPTLPPESVEAPVHRAADPAPARAELERTHCVTVEGLLGPEDRAALERRIAAVRAEKDGCWAQVGPDEEPELHRLFGAALAGPAFREITGWTTGRDDYTLTLSLQSLDRCGIGWHRDLYWPREWVGEDVFAVLYALGSDAPEKGGAFAYRALGGGEVRHVWRRRHQATILWNAADDGGRILHAVTGYSGEDTERLLVILQCRRRTAREGGEERSRTGPVRAEPA